MKLISIIIYDNIKNEILHSVYNLSSYSFYKRRYIRNYIDFGINSFVPKLNTPDYVSCVNVNEYLCYALKGDKTDEWYSYIIVSEPIELSQNIAYALLYKIRDEHQRQGNLGQENLGISSFLMEMVEKEYDNIRRDPKVTRIKNDLNETKETMIMNIEKLLDRGDTLEDLIERTDKLSHDSKTFYKASKKLNRCCIII